LGCEIAGTGWIFKWSITASAFGSAEFFGIGIGTLQFVGSITREDVSEHRVSDEIEQGLGQERDDRAESL